MINFSCQCFSKNAKIKPEAYLKYKINAHFIVILAVLLGIFLLFIRNYVSIVFLKYIILFTYIFLFSFSAFIFTISKKYIEGQRNIKRTSALKNAASFTKLYDKSDSIIIFNRQVVLKYEYMKKKIIFSGLTRTSKTSVILTASSDIPYLTDNVWDYLCFYFDRTFEVSHIFHICRTNCLNVSIAEKPEDISEGYVINELNNDCRINPAIDFRREPMVDINTLQIDDLLKINGVDKVAAEKIIKYRTEQGPFYSFEQLHKKLKLNKKLVEAIEAASYISIPVLNRYKIEQSLDLV